MDLTGKMKPIPVCKSSRPSKYWSNAICTGFTSLLMNTVMACNCSMCCFSFNSFPIRAHLKPYLNYCDSMSVHYHLCMLRVHSFCSLVRRMVHLFSTFSLTSLHYSHIHSFPKGFRNYWHCRVYFQGFTNISKSVNSTHDGNRQTSNSFESLNLHK